MASSAAGSGLGRRLRRLAAARADGLDRTLGTRRCPRHGCPTSAQERDCERRPAGTGSGPDRGPWPAVSSGLCLSQCRWQKRPGAPGGRLPPQDSDGPDHPDPRPPSSGPAVPARAPADDSAVEFGGNGERPRQRPSAGRHRRPHPGPRVVRRFRPSAQDRACRPHGRPTCRGPYGRADPGRAGTYRPRPGPGSGVREPRSVLVVAGIHVFRQTELLHEPAVELHRGAHPAHRAGDEVLQ